MTSPSHTSVHPQPPPATDHQITGVDPDAALRAILEGTATATGERFFAELVKCLAQALGTWGAWVTEYDEQARRLRSLAFWMDGQWVGEYEYAIDGTPCEAVIDGRHLVHYPDNIVELYPGDNDLNRFNAVSFLGLPLLDADDRVIGHLAALDTRPMPHQPRLMAMFRIFAARAAAELQRVRTEAALRERETKLGLLIGTAMDAIVELDEHLRVTITNPAAQRIFGVQESEAIGRSFSDLAGEDCLRQMRDLIPLLDRQPQGEQYLWIGGGVLDMCRGCGGPFPAEATLSRYEMRGRPFYTLILRNVNERVEAERRIRSLTAEAEYLREELRDMGQFDQILGRSRPLRRLLHEIHQVADTDATVLIMGETGTGKELIARAIHSTSSRREQPLVKVNCAAIPATLIESEFFGHARGAFTGATEKRDGRFSLADGGTIFLDEVGELPLDLQSKLLRVLQEGEFEPVGSSRTIRVDVRVVAATNRDLQEQVRKGGFREDLFYRLNVFPMHVPPLRERVDDVGLLAQTFADRFAQRMGRRIAPLTQTCIARLEAYHWPGNVRELENVIERAVITSVDGRLNLDRALPATEAPPPAPAVRAGDDGSARVRTVAEMQELEKANIILALESANWRVSGAGGAADLLGMKPSTLNSRMKALGITRPK